MVSPGNYESLIDPSERERVRDSVVHITGLSSEAHALMVTFLGKKYIVCNQHILGSKQQQYSVSIQDRYRTYLCSLTPVQVKGDLVLGTLSKNIQIKHMTVAEALLDQTVSATHVLFGCSV